MGHAMPKECIGLLAFPAGVITALVLSREAPSMRLCSSCPSLHDSYSSEPGLALPRAAHAAAVHGWDMLGPVRCTQKRMPSSKRARKKHII